MCAFPAAAMLFAVTSACAAPVKIAETADTVVYVDSDSIADKNGLRRVAVVHDYATQQPGGVRSRRVAYEIDCRSERLRSVAVSEHRQPMAAADSMSAWERESQWLYVAPRTGSNLASSTPYRAIARFACSR